MLKMCLTNTGHNLYRLKMELRERGIQRIFSHQPIYLSIKLDRATKYFELMPTSWLFYFHMANKFEVIIGKKRTDSAESA